MRKFYRTLITLEVLSEYEPVPEDISMEQLGQEIDMGDWSGMIKDCVQQELTAKEMVKYTMDQGSDPGFFCLDANGNDVLEHELGLNLTVDHGHVYTDGDAKDGE